MAAKAKKPLAVTGDEAESRVLELLLRENRPYNAQLVSDNTAGSVKKPTAQKCLEDLVVKGQVKAKDFGKNRVYFPNQDLLPRLTAEEEAALDAQISEVKQEEANLTARYKKISTETAALKACMSDEELDVILATLDQDVTAKREAKRKREVMEGAAEDPEAAAGRKIELAACGAKLQKALKKAAAAWKKRRCQCRGIISAIACGASEADILEKFGLDGEAPPST
ncbi:Homologous-pairing protein 2 [Diplonema papillatum]|nr:Homologous-pairing protein 2 [Diplonema papillatum]